MSVLKVHKPGEVGKTFNQSAQKPAKIRRKPSANFSIRFTEEERARLNREAGKQSLSRYIRRKLFGEAAVERKPQYRRKQRRAKMDHEVIGKLLARLGQSELAASLIALAMAAQSGALPVTPELTGKLEQACDDIGEMRTTLIVALHVKPEEGQ